MTIGMARKSGRRRRAALAIALAILLVGVAVALGSLWSLYRAYPFKWQDEIKQNAALYGQDPLLIAAIIRTESSWRQTAVSSVGATGLMQIMPDTGGWIVHRHRAGAVVAGARCSGFAGRGLRSARVLLCPCPATP